MDDENMKVLLMVS